MTFAQFIDWLAAASAVITAVNIYLMVNKIWGRKHIKDVAESISVSAYALSFALAVPFFLKFGFFEVDYVSMAVYGLWMVLYVIYVAIGAGVWVAEKRGRSFFAKLKAAIRLERDEIGTLVQAFAQPESAELVARVLARVAAIDGDVDEREMAMMDSVLDGWGMRLSESEVARYAAEEPSFQAIRDDLSAYLEARPPVEQATQVQDLINHLIRADEVVTEEEQLLMDEAEALIGQYVSGDAGATMYEALLVPQNAQQADQIAAMLGDADRPADAGTQARLGGHAFLLGSFFSERFAEAVAAPYRERGLFSVVHRATATA